jgi:hypothetical protein
MTGDIHVPPFGGLKQDILQLTVGYLCYSCLCAFSLQGEEIGEVSQVCRLRFLEWLSCYVELNRSVTQSLRQRRQIQNQVRDSRLSFSFNNFVDKVRSQCFLTKAVSKQLLWENCPLLQERTLLTLEVSLSFILISLCPHNYLFHNWFW